MDGHRGDGDHRPNPKYVAPVFIAVFCFLSVCTVLAVLDPCQCLLASWCHNRRRRRLVPAPVPRPMQQQQQQQQQMPCSCGSSSSAAQLIPAAAAVSYEKSGGGEGEGACAVCLADFEEGKAVRVLPECGHCFHAACIDAWLRARASCPVCRAEMAPPPVRSCHVDGGV